MKLTRALIPVAAVALLLTGCSVGSDADSKTPSDCVAAGAASKQVKVEGDLGGELKLTSKTPIESKKLERSVLIDGKGKAPTEGDELYTTLNFFKGSDGSLIQATPESPIAFSEQGLAPWAYDALRCAVPGQRVALTAPVKDIFGEGGQLESMGVKDTDTVITVIDVTKYGEKPELLKKAEGKAQPAPEGFPTVKLDADGAPTITIPEGLQAPSKLEIATLIEGDGETVKPGDKVWVNYRGVIWRTGEEFDSSWKRGTPIEFTTTGVIGGFSKALEGQKVGSQVISVVPAEDGGYGAEALKQQGHEPDDVMVFVLDILGVQHNS